MKIYYRRSTDPFTNIAAEEYFARNTGEDLCMIWCNEKSVIIGKHQNAYAEINYPFICEHQIPVIRRISGGGAVYHDEGNINFTFIQKTGTGNQVAFKQFTAIVVKMMKHFGLDVQVGKRDSLYIHEKKFSGNAEHIYKDRILHHGTLLFNTNLDWLEQSIKSNKSYQSKALQSVRSEVCNLAPLLPDIKDKEEFIKYLLQYLLDIYREHRIFEVDEIILNKINFLSESKYRTWQWNFGYSPAYSFVVELPLRVGNLPFTCRVENGTIKGIELMEQESKPNLEFILNKLIGILHREEDILTFSIQHKQELMDLGITALYFTQAFFQ